MESVIYHPSTFPHIICKTLGIRNKNNQNLINLLSPLLYFFLLWNVTPFLRLFFLFCFYLKYFYYCPAAAYFLRLAVYTYSSRRGKIFLLFSLFFMATYTSGVFDGFKKWMSILTIYSVDIYGTCCLCKYICFFFWIYTHDHLQTRPTQKFGRDA